MPTLTPLFSFPTIANTSAISVTTPVVDAAGDLIFTRSTRSATTGAVSGAIYELAAAPGGFATAPVVLATVAGQVGGLISDGAGNLFGIAAGGGPGGAAMVFELPKTAVGFGPLLPLATLPAGEYGSLAFDAAGDLFGATRDASRTSGRLFELTKTVTGYAAAATTLVTFTSSTAWTGGLAVDADGTVIYDSYAPAPDYGYNAYALRLSSAGTYASAPAKIYNTVTGFNGDIGAIKLDGAGNVFIKGSDYVGESLTYIPKLAAGSYGAAALIDYEDAMYGHAGPEDTLLLDSDGSIFFPAVSGGDKVSGNAPGAGAIVRVDKVGGAYQSYPYPQVTQTHNGSHAIYNFALSGGRQVAPLSGLAPDSSGNLYGLTLSGGGGGGGYLYRLSDAGFDAPTTASVFTLTLPATYNGQPNDTGASSSDGVTRIATPTFTGTATAGAQVGVYEGATLLGFGSADASGAYAITVSRLSDGAHAVTADVAAVQTGAAGVGLSQATPPLTVVIDTAPPSPPAITGFADDTGTPGDRITADTTPTLSGTTEPGAAIQVFRSGSPVGATTATGSGAWSFTSAALPDGAYAFSAVATDLAGNTSGASPAFGITILTAGPPPANTPPAIAGTASGQADTAGAPIRPFAAVTVTDPDAGQTETATVSFPAANGTLSGGGFAGGNGSYTVSGTAADVQAALRSAQFTPVAGQATTTTLTLSVSDGIATATDANTSVVATYAAPPVGGGGGGGGPQVRPSDAAGLLIEIQNLTRALAGSADVQVPGTPLYEQVRAAKAVVAQYDAGQISLAQAEQALAHVVDGTVGVAVASYAFFTGRTPTLEGLNFLAHSQGNPTDLNDPYYARLSTENRFINFAVNLATGPGAGAAAFAATYGPLSLADAVAKGYQAVFGPAAEAGKVSAILNGLVPDGLGGLESRAQYFAQYGGDGAAGLGTKAAALGYLLAQSVHDGVGVFGAAEAHYAQALAHGAAPRFDTELVLTYGAAPPIIGQPMLDPTLTMGM